MTSDAQHGADELRAAVAWFNRQPKSLSSIETLTDYVLRIADRLDSPAAATPDGEWSMRAELRSVT